VRLEGKAGWELSDVKWLPADVKVMEDLKCLDLYGTDVFLDAGIQAAVEETLRRKAETRHYAYIPIPVTSQRYRFVALNEMAKRLVQE
jgi:hypothetical protein